MTMETMRAVRLEAWGAGPVLREVPVPTPGHGEVLLRVDAAGLCHSDLSVMNAAPGRLNYRLPMTLGHEIAGTVIRLGEGVESDWLGKQVLVHGVWSCRTCRNCHRGRQNYCLSFAGTEAGSAPIGAGLGYDGGLADFVLVPSTEYLVPADGVDPQLLAPLADAGLTTFHAIASHRDIVDDDGTVLVLGIGGLGHLAVQILRDFGCGRIVAVDPRPEARDLARGLGAHVVAADLADVAVDLASSGGVDLVLDFVGAQSTVEPALQSLAPGGRLAVVGSAGGCIQVGKSEGLAMGWQVNAPFWGNYENLREVVDLARSGRMSSHVEVFGLDDVVEVYERLARGDITGRAVIVPDSTASLRSDPIIERS
ncbi:MAG: NAD(P)-dependent alcohol dehydrogenase [Rhodococcus sp. (in: high G+C Gram-positive bacteria)]|uniref:NAD(P)-dependent alcohol dehydrogenase n=1 Tax=Rhodococcus sp. TaxID=1831 RepID=UPI003BAF4CD4